MHSEDHHIVTHGPLDQEAIIHGLALGVIDGPTGETGMALTRHGREVHDHHE